MTWAQSGGEGGEAVFLFFLVRLRWSGPPRAALAFAEVKFGADANLAVCFAFFAAYHVVEVSLFFCKVSFKSC